MPIRGVSEQQASLGRSLLSGSMGERKGHLQRNCRHKGTEGLVWLLWEMEQQRALLGEEASEMGLSAGVASVPSPRASVRTALGHIEQGRSLHLTRALELGSELAPGSWCHPGVRLLVSCSSGLGEWSPPSHAHCSWTPWPYVHIGVGHRAREGKSKRLCSLHLSSSAGTLWFLLSSPGRLPLLGHWPRLCPMVTSWEIKPYRKARN